jgi:hypothetical protein
MVCGLLLILLSEIEKSMTLIIITMEARLNRTALMTILSNFEENFGKMPLNKLSCIFALYIQFGMLLWLKKEKVH